MRARARACTCTRTYVDTHAHMNFLINTLVPNGFSTALVLPTTNIESCPLFCDFTLGHGQGSQDMPQGQQKPSTCCAEAANLAPAWWLAFGSLGPGSRRLLSPPFRRLAPSLSWEGFLGLSVVPVLCWGGGTQGPCSEVPFPGQEHYQVPQLKSLRTETRPRAGGEGWDSVSRDQGPALLWPCQHSGCTQGPQRL